MPKTIDTFIFCNNIHIKDEIIHEQTYAYS